MRQGKIRWSSHFQLPHVTLSAVLPMCLLSTGRCRYGLENEFSQARMADLLVSGTKVASELILEQLQALPATHPQLLQQLHSTVPGSAPRGLLALQKAFHAAGDHALSLGRGGGAGTR